MLCKIGSVNETDDPDGDDVFYEIDWGDGQVESWDGPYESNEIIIKDHSWDYEGTFIVSARAKDVYENIGDWGELEITIPRNRLVTYPFILQLFERFPDVLPVLHNIFKL
jgi:hypothetical protein